MNPYNNMWKSYTAYRVKQDPMDIIQNNLKTSIDSEFSEYVYEICTSKNVLFFILQLLIN